MIANLALTYRTFLLEALLPGVIIVGLLSANIAPPGFDDAAFPVRLFFWTAATALACLVLCWSNVVIEARIASLSPKMREIVTIIVVATVFAPLFWLLLWATTMFAVGMAPRFAAALQFGVIFGAALLLVRRGVGVTGARSPRSENQCPRLLRRLPADAKGQILRLSARNHYVDVVTTTGTHTIRMRLTDAINEMEPLQGHCAHRSHWVVETGIAATERHDGKLHLRLSNGDLVPVGRKYRPALEEAGLI